MKFRFLIFTTVLILVSALSLGLNAQDTRNEGEETGTEETAAAEETEPQAQSENAGNEAASGGEPETASMERFKPSEDISHDRSVAFPNDI